MKLARFSTAAAAFVCAAIPSVAHAVVSLQVVVEPPDPVAGQVFRVIYGVQVRNDTAVETTPLELPGLEVLSNPGGPQLPQFGMFNGANLQVSMNSQVEYIVRAPRAGRFTIQGARAIDPQSRRVVYQHPPVVLIVRASGANAPPQPGVQPGAQPPQPMFPPGFPQAFPPGFPDPFGQPAPPPEPVADPDAPPTGALTGGIFNPDGFIRYSVDNPTPYIGQQVTLRAWLYVPAFDAACEPDREPVLNGFWSEVLVLNRDVCARRWIPQNVNGRQMAAGMVRKIALFPTHAGRLEVGSMAMNAEFIMGDGFLGTRRRMSAQSPSIVVDVREAPAAGRPSNYVPGLVGPVSLSATVDRPNVAVGETVTLTVEAVGNGYIGSVGLPAPVFPDGLRMHPGASSSSLDHNTESPRGTLRVSYLLVPTRPGSIALAPLTVPWLDATTGRYETARVALPTLNVTGAALEAEHSERETDPSLELEPTIPSPSLTPHREIFTTPARAVGAIGFPPLALALAALARWAKRRSEARKTERDARMQNDPLALLSQSQIALAASDFTRATALAGRALDKALKEYGVASLDDDGRALVREAQAECDTARFAGASTDAGAQAIVEKVTRAVERMEKAS